MFDIKKDRDLLIKVAKSKGFAYPEVANLPYGEGIDRDPKTIKLHDNWISILYGATKPNLRLPSDYLLITPANRDYFRLNNSDVIEYIRNEKLKELLHDQ